jgi:hypothetical protein
MRCEQLQEATENGDSGSHPVIQLRLKRSIFGGRSSTIFTRIRVGRDWFGVRAIGAIRQRTFMCPTAPQRRKLQLRQLIGRNAQSVSVCSGGKWRAAGGAGAETCGRRGCGVGRPAHNLGRPAHNKRPRKVGRPAVGASAGSGDPRTTMGDPRTAARLAHNLANPTTTVRP